MRFTPSIIAILMVSSVTAWAQAVPDAGSLMRQTEQTFKFDQAQRSARQRQSLPPAMLFDDSTAFTVQRFKFTGNKILSSEQLQVVVSPYVNRELNQHDLHQLIHAVTEAYRSTGWIVQAYIPRQNLKNEEIVLQVIEGVSPAKPAN
jgi:hemolysin activation/secretion protein